MNLSSVTHPRNWIPLAQRTRCFLAKGPIYIYTYGRWRLDGWWHRRINTLADTVRPPDAAFFLHLDLERQALAGVKQALAQGNYDGARAKFVAYLCARDRPRFHFTATDRSSILSIIPQEQKDATLRAANQVCDNLFSFRRVTVRFESRIDWQHSPGGNTDWTWDLNRHPYFITLGKAYWYTSEIQYVEKFIELLHDWIQANPAGVGWPNWDSVLEVAVRLNTWIWAYFIFCQADVLQPQEHIVLLQGILTHARYLAARIEHHAANNHLLLEAKALAFCGLLFPEFRGAKVWQETGLRILWRQVERQVCPDGVHGERSPQYHRRILSDLIEMLVLLENNELPVPEDILHRSERMLDFDVHITKPDGTIPLFSDSSLLELQARFLNQGGVQASDARATLLERVVPDGDQLDEDMAWLLGSRWSGRKAQTPHTGVHNAQQSSRGQASAARQPSPRDDARSNARALVSRAFPQGGYFVMRGGTGQSGMYLAFDCGPFGYKPCPVHGHADALHFDMYAYGRSLLTDCGTYSYHMGDRWRNYFRGTRAHNTIVVDGQDQSRLLGSMNVYRMAHATLHRWISNAHFDFVHGSHDGYSHLAKPVIHHRKILFIKPENRPLHRPPYWIVLDLLTGRQAPHKLEQYYHLMPWAHTILNHESKTVHVEQDGVPVLTIAPLHTPALCADILCGATDPIQGWVSFFSGEKVVAPVLRYSMDVPVPTCLVTVLYPHPAGSAPVLRVLALAVSTRDGDPLDATNASALRIETAEHVDTCLVAHTRTTSWRAFAEYESDGDLVFVRHRKRDGAILRLYLQRGRSLVYRGQTLLGADGLPRRAALDCKIGFFDPPQPYSEIRS
jgi:uncharacterized heparinase superfamily protein